MKSPVATAVGIAIGLTILIGYFLRPVFGERVTSILSVFLDWAIILAGFATLVGILNLLAVHLRKVRTRQTNAFYSMITIVAFVLTFLAGLGLTPSNAQFKQVVIAIQFPVEASLMAVLAVTLLYSGIRFFRRRPLDLLAITFAISVLVFLGVNLSYFTAGSTPPVEKWVLLINRLPSAGARGILLGVALGSLTTGLRVLLGADRPYGG